MPVDSRQIFVSVRRCRIVKRVTRTNPPPAGGGSNRKTGSRSSYSFEILNVHSGTQLRNYIYVPTVHSITRPVPLSLSLDLFVHLFRIFYSATSRENLSQISHAGWLAQHVLPQRDTINPRQATLPRRNHSLMGSFRK